MVMVYAGQELEKRAEEFVKMLNEDEDKVETQSDVKMVIDAMTAKFSRLTLMTALHGGYIVFAQSGNDQVVLFAGCLRECLEFMGKSVERA
jgi:hypothetical protein